jgi:outer membrane scaffolding protein for murein synthesis (MipA/OmpV family)
MRALGGGARRVCVRAGECHILHWKKGLSMRISFTTLCTALAASALCAPPAAAQDEESGRRVRVGLGAQLVPSFPGSDHHDIIPLVDVATARGDKPFAFEAADESFGFAIIKSGGLGIGIAANVEGSRSAKDVGAPLDKVSTTFEVGSFIQYQFSPNFRARTEVRRGIGGHEGWIGVVGADYILRDGDAYLFYAGPRVTLSDSKYHRAYFGVTSAAAARSGLAAYSPEGGVHAVGATAGFLTQLTKRWGLYSYAKYDRLIGDAGRSPVVRTLGSRDQLSGGLALTYTFGNR